MQVVAQWLGRLGFESRLSHQLFALSEVTIKEAFHTLNYADSAHPIKNSMFSVSVLYLLVIFMVSNTPKDGFVFLDFIKQ